MTVLLMVLVIAVIFVVSAIIIYNRLVSRKILVEEAWSGIGTFLQQRYDMIPPLVEAVKGYALHESNTLTEVVKWRNKGMAATSRPEQMEAGTGINRALNNFFAVAEQYPDLKASTNFLALQNALKDMENRLNLSRRYYNGTVRNLNQSISLFPNNILAGFFGFKPARFFEEDEDAHEIPQVSFNR